VETPTARPFSRLRSLSAGRCTALGRWSWRDSGQTIGIGAGYTTAGARCETSLSASIPGAIAWRVQPRRWRTTVREDASHRHKRKIGTEHPAPRSRGQPLLRYPAAVVSAFGIQESERGGGRSM